MDMAAVYNIELYRFPNQGKATFYVKMMDGEGSLPPRSNNYHFKSEKTPNKSGYQNLTLDSNQRVSRWPLCASYYSSLLADGSQKCIIAISVSCETSDQCAWRLKINQQNVKIVDQPAKILNLFTLNPPMPILSTQYTNDFVTADNIRYFYFPLDHRSIGKTVIVVNKTQIFGTGRNGDSQVFMNV
jgi:hypothetical protein